MSGAPTVEQLYATARDLARVEDNLPPSHRWSAATPAELAWVREQLENPHWRGSVDAAVRAVVLDRWNTAHRLTEAVARLAARLDPANMATLGARRTLAVAELDAELARPGPERGTGADDATLYLVRRRMAGDDWREELIGLGRTVIRDWPLPAPLTRLLLALAQQTEDLA